MLNLTEGIKLYDYNPPSLEEPPRVELSTGTTAANATSLAELYSESASIPKEPWRVPSSRENEILYIRTLPETMPTGSWISVVQVPTRVYTYFAALREVSRTIKDPKEFQDLLEQGNYQDSVLFAINYITAFTMVPQPHDLVGGVFAAPPNAQTTTRDNTGRFLGMHVDGWYKLTLEEKLAAPNRISINIGYEDRFLLYINLTLQQVSQIMQEQHQEVQERYEYMIGLRTAFMKYFPEYPVVRVRIKPGEAYIAPTENFIHDGSSFGQSTLDIQVNARGIFDPIPTN